MLITGSDDAIVHRRWLDGRRGHRSGSPRVKGESMTTIHRVAQPRVEVGAEQARITGAPTFAPSIVNVRVKISALWASMLFVFAYVDLFSLYRSDVRADLEAGEIGGFTVNQAFLLGTTVYVVIPSLMVFLALVL
jgi:Family of unknown function (DUF6326)